MEIPVYLFTGFLEAGKSTFIQGTLEDTRFNAGESTLLLLCEEGEVEYDFARMPDGGSNITVRTVESEDELTPENLAAWQKDCRAKRVMVEYNGMWMLDRLFTAMPEGWTVYQELFFVDATTFLTYNTNMRSLVVDKLQSCELTVFNRYRADIDKLQLHKIVRATSRRSDIAYEYPNGDVEYDDIEDPLPFDVNAPIIEIADTDYALWYRDLNENMDTYNGKTVKFKGIVAVEGRMPANSFAIGRHIMTCCEDDIAYGGIVCDWKGAKTLKQREWVMLTARLSVEYHKAYRKRGPVLKAVKVEPAEAPEQQLATFY